MASMKVLRTCKYQSKPRFKPGVNLVLLSMFIAIAVGLFIATLATPLFAILVKKEYMKAVAQGKSHADPEAMLWWAMIGAPFLPASLFWMGWSAYPSVSFWSPMIA